jgi:cytochrome c oxidase subunit 3
VNFFDQLTEKPWLGKESPAVDPRVTEESILAAPKTGLRWFLIVVTMVFTLFIAAYAERMELSDWSALPLPSLLWLNTFLLILSSVALQKARNAAKDGRIDSMKGSLFAGGIFVFAFLAGQLLAWQQLVAMGYFAAANPANAFFYLVTALHGLHLIGGLVAWGRTMARVRGDFDIVPVRVSVDLCADYWHFMLLVWLVLFALLLVT